VLLLAQEYPFSTQTQIVPALAALYNFIVIHDPEILQDEDEIEPNADDGWNSYHSAIPRDEQTRASERRDRIAMEMWEEYIARPPRRRR
jgi:hypothetical protein